MPFDDIETADAATYARAFRALAAILRHLLPDYAVGSKGDARGVLPRHFAPDEIATPAAPGRGTEVPAPVAPTGAGRVAPMTAIDAALRLAPTTLRDGPADVARSA
ncbi:MAG TPA: hypothetical protein VF159_03130 [Gemmatimonadaceae bacterium]